MPTATSCGAPTGSGSQKIDIANSDVSDDAREELESVAERVYSAHAASDPSELDLVQPLAEPSETDEDLCERCAGICFDEEKIRARMEETQKFLPGLRHDSIHIGSVYSLHGDCKLCRMFQKM